MSIFQHSSVRLQKLIDTIRGDDNLNGQVFPGFADLLEKIVDVNIDVPREESVRQLLGVFYNSVTDGTYSDVLAKYHREEERRIRSFVQDGEPATSVGKDFHIGPSLGAREELPVIDADGDGIPDELEDDAAATVTTKSMNGLTLASDYVNLYDDEQQKTKVLVYADEKFQNWGRTVGYTPSLTFVPRTSHGIQQIVQYAKTQKMNVRAAGYRHSWAPLFGTEKQITISTLGLTRASMLPNIESLPGSQYLMPQTQLNSIDFVGKPQPNEKRLIRVGTAVTNQQFRRWCNSQGEVEASTLPFNVIMVEITLGGSNAPICHGAGRDHKTLSDLVHTIEYVDANGNMQTLSKDKDPKLMTAAAGCFGLLGIVTHLTLELDPMSWTAMTPQKIPVMQAIPPPPDMEESEIPEPLRISMTPKQRAQAQAEFEAHAKSDFYSEWFWFPYTSQVWVNCWNPTQDSAGSTEYPPPGDVFLQFAETVLLQIMQTSEAVCNLQEMFPWAQATLISKMGLYALPDVTDPKQPIKTTLPNALHFRRAIQNIRVRDMEIEIPLQPKHGLLEDAQFNDEVDWSLVQRAFWDAVILAYKYKHTCPQRMPLEMRITGSSDIVMAPFRGNPLGTCSIEVLTLQDMNSAWTPYTQAVLDKWMDLKDNQGNYLNTRPHWAKEWSGLYVRGEPILEYLKRSYAESISEFNEIMQQIAMQQGWTVEDQRERFSNAMFDQLFFGKESTNGTVNGHEHHEGIMSEIVHGITNGIAKIFGHDHSHDHSHDHGHVDGHVNGHANGIVNGHH